MGGSSEHPFWNAFLGNRCDIPSFGNLVTPAARSSGGYQKYQIKMSHVVDDNPADKRSHQGVKTNPRRQPMELKREEFDCPFKCGFTGLGLKGHLERKHGAQSSSQIIKQVKEGEKMAPTKPHTYSSRLELETCTSAPAIPMNIRENHGKKLVPVQTNPSGATLDIMRYGSFKMDQRAKPKESNEEKVASVKCFSCRGIIENMKPHSCFPKISKLNPPEMISKSIFKCSRCEFSANTRLEVETHELTTTHGVGRTGSFGRQSATVSSSGMEIVKRGTEDNKGYKQGIKSPFNFGSLKARDNAQKQAKTESCAKAPKIVTRKRRIPQMGEKTFECVMCKYYVGATKGLLKSHMKRVHAAVDKKITKKEPR